MRGHGVNFFEKKAEKSRISHRVSGGGSGSTQTVDARLKYAPSWNQIQTLKNCLCCHIYCVHRCTHLYRNVTAYHVVSNGESRLFERVEGTGIRPDCAFYYFYCFVYILYECVCRHKYVFCFAFTCLHVFCFFWLNSLGVDMHTWARVQVDGIDEDGIDPVKDDVEERTYGKGRCIQKWTFFQWTWYVCMGNIDTYEYWNRDPWTVCKHLAKPLSAGIQRRIVIEIFIL